MEGSSDFPTAALRDQFGDQRPPDITRKITACAACRKQKIRCHMHDGKAPCTRCKQRGLTCQVNKSLQTILESDIVWKESVEQKIKRLETLYERLTRHVAPLQLGVPAEEAIDTVNTHPAGSDSTEHHWEIVMDPESGPGAVPGSVVSQIAATNSQDSRIDQDLISRGILSNAEAQACLDTYQNRLDHFLYRIIGERRTLSQIRNSSSLLLAAICAVGSLHLASPRFDKLHEEFVSAAAAQTFSRRHNVDDVRALCVGAFWLSGISWACIGTAVRISTEMQLHRSIFKAVEGDEAHYHRTRLYYILFVCNHQFSVPYGRPPMMPTDEAIRSTEAFLGSKFASEDDARVVSQVRFWQIGAEVFDHFGINVDRPLDLSMIEPLRRFSIRFDRIRADWSERFLHNQYVGNYPRKGVGLHYHFIKLYLFSHAFRGIGHPDFKAANVALDVDELANAAMLSATSILRAIVSDAEIQDYLNGLPTYFDLMIAFAVVFVLKVSTMYASLVHIDAAEVQNLVLDLVAVLKRITSTMHERHLLASVARGAESLVHRCRSSTTNGTSRGIDKSIVNDYQSFDDTLHILAAGGGASQFDGFDAFDMGDFDLLSGQDFFAGL